MDKLALVTGASSGIGYWLANDLATRGYDLVICSAGERVAEAANDLRSAGVSVTMISTDLATREGIDLLWGPLLAAILSSRSSRTCGISKRWPKRARFRGLNLSPTANAESEAP